MRIRRASALHAAVEMIHVPGYKPPEQSIPKSVPAGREELTHSKKQLRRRMQVFKRIVLGLVPGGGVEPP
jgi:hypothetical protein